ncbi:MAG TPA: ferritin-like domain-containing protein [Mariprofundaceae bacterium]|nr:ferritin-like domain-containing protein [Mariprofundaceae bacterium]
MSEFLRAVRQALAATDPDDKLRLTRAAVQLAVDVAAFGEPLEVGSRGRPMRPQLVAPHRVPRRGFGTPVGRRMLLHAIVHIEFNAINLALDAVQRFAGMPANYYADWLRVAAEEAYHFEILRGHLRHLGGDYGDYPAHNGLWEMAEKTSGDVLERMALVPRVLEARGLDVTPGIREKLVQAGDLNAASLLDIIFRDEVGHVATGTRWFRYLCDQRSLEPESTFFALIAKHFPDGLHGPYGVDARRTAGFSDSELRLLSA